MIFLNMQYGGGVPVHISSENDTYCTTSEQFWFKSKQKAKENNKDWLKEGEWWRYSVKVNIPVKFR